MTLTILHLPLFRIPTQPYLQSGAYSRRIQRVSFLTRLVDKQLRPEILPSGDPRFDAGHVDYGWVFRASNSQVRYRRR